MAKKEVYTINESTLGFLVQSIVNGIQSRFARKKTVDDLQTSLSKLDIRIQNVEVEDIPIGTVIEVLGKTPPTGYVRCDGTVYSISLYRDLANFINKQFGTYNKFGGNGTSSFAVPNLDGSAENLYKFIKVM